MNEGIVVVWMCSLGWRASETMHEKRTRMIFTVDPPLLSTFYSYIRVDPVTKSITKTLSIYSML